MSEVWIMEGGSACEKRGHASCSVGMGFSIQWGKKFLLDTSYYSPANSVRRRSLMTGSVCSYVGSLASKGGGGSGRVGDIAFDIKKKWEERTPISVYCFIHDSW